MKTELEAEVLNIMINDPMQLYDNINSLQEKLFSGNFQIICRGISHLVEKEIEVTIENLLLVLKELDSTNDNIKRILKKFKLLPIKDKLAKIGIQTLIEFYRHDIGSQIMTKINKRIRKGTFTFQMMFDAVSEFEELNITINEDEPELIENITEIMKKDIVHNRLGISSGFADYDTYLGGYKGGNLYVVGADTGVGKSSMCLAGAINQSIRDKKKIMWFALEMSKSEIVEKLISYKYKISNQEYFANDKETKISMIDSIAKMFKKKDSGTFLIDDNTFDTQNIVSKIKKAHRKNGVDIVYIDYFQLMHYADGKSFGNSNSEYEEMSKRFKRLAKNLNIPVVLIIQLNNKEIAKRGNKFPQKSDARGSSAPINDSTTTMLIYRPEHYGIKKYNNQDTKGKAWSIIDKNRFGKLGQIEFNFNNKCALFTDKK
jgi:replicative DNA helicase